MKALKLLIPTLAPFTHQDAAWKLQLMQQWSTIMGSLAERVSIAKIEQDTITLSACDASWMHELYMLSGLIKQKINQALGAPYITNIRFKQTITQKKEHTKYVSLGQPETVRMLTTREIKALQKITDEELSHAMKGFLYRCLRSS